MMLTKDKMAHKASYGAVTKLRPGIWPFETDANSVIAICPVTTRRL
jgi:hypothetical protein